MAPTQIVTQTKQTKLIGIFLIIVQCVFFIVVALGAPLKFNALIFVLVVIFLGVISTIFAIKNKLFQLFWTSNYYILFSLEIYLIPYLQWITFVIFMPLLVVNMILNLTFLAKMPEKKPNLKS